jgi:hypothetical protein
MKRFFALSMILAGMLFFCACEKEMIQSDPLQEDLSALKKAASNNGMTQMELTPLPMAVRLGGGAPYVIPATDEYGIITFYVNDPGVIPVDHNFNHPMGWFVLDAWFLDQEEFSIEGSSWFLPDYPDAPHHYHMKGKGNVLFWIITFDQVLELYDDGNGVITIPKIADCNPLVGYAKSYTENVRPYGGGAHVFGGVFTAEGTLIDGRRFIYNAHTKAFPGEPMKGIYHFKIFDK